MEIVLLAAKVCRVEACRVSACRVGARRVSFCRIDAGMAVLSGR